MEGVEVKFLDTVLDDAAISTGGTVQTSVCLIPENTGESGRKGRNAVAVGVKWRATFNLQALAASAVPDGDSVRYLWLVDHQCNGANPAVLDILETADFHAHMNKANDGRFEVLADEVFSMDYMGAAGAAAAADYPGVHLQAEEELPVEEKLQFDGATGAITELTAVNIVLLLISQNGTAAMTSIARLLFLE